MNMRLLFWHKKGYTLTELVLAITVSVLLLSGLGGFLEHTISQISFLKDKSAMHVALTDWIDEMNKQRNKYTNVAILSDGESATGSGFATVMLTNTGKTQGVLVGVVNTTIPKGEYRLEQLGQRALYQHRAIAVHKLTSSQITTLVASATNMANIPIYTDEVYADLFPTRFDSQLYNGATLVNFDIMLSPTYSPENLTVPAFSEDESKLESVNLFF